MSAACESIRRRLPAYGGEELSEAVRRQVRGHLAHCAACRAEAASQDATLLFAGLPAPEVSSEEIASLVASVRAGVALRQTERRIAEASKRRDDGSHRALRVAAAVAVAVLTLAVPSGLRNPDAEAPASLPTHAGSPAVTGAAPEGAVETSSGATVYDWSPGAGEPRVVWIVDGSLDI